MVTGGSRFTGYSWFSGDVFVSFDSSLHSFFSSSLALSNKWSIFLFCLSLLPLPLTASPWWPSLPYDREKLIYFKTWLKQGYECSISLRRSNILKQRCRAAKPSPYFLVMNMKKISNFSQKSNRALIFKWLY